MPDNEQLGLPFGPPGTGTSTGNWAKAGPSHSQKRLLDNYNESLHKLEDSIGRIVKKVGALMGMSGGTRSGTIGDGSYTITDTSVPTSHGKGVFSRNGDSNTDHLGSLYAIQQGAQALSSGSLRIGGALDRTAQSGVSWQFSGYRLGNRTGNSTLMETARLRSELTGFNDTADAMAGTNLLINSMYRPNQAQFSSLLKGAGGISVLTGMGYSQSASILAGLGSSQVTNRLGMYGGGLTDRSGNIQQTGDALRSLATIALTGSGTSNLSASALAQRGSTAFNLSGGNAAGNLRSLGLSDDTIIAVNEYLQKSGKSGKWLSTSDMAGLNVPGRAFQKTAESQAEKESKIYDKTYKSMEQFQAQLQHLNSALGTVPGGIASLGFWAGKATQGVMGLAQGALSIMFLMRGLGALGGLGGASSAASVGGPLSSALVASARGLGLGGLGLAGGAGLVGLGALGGMAGGALGRKMTGGSKAGGVLGGAAGGAAVGAGLGLLGGPFTPLTSGAGALIGGGIGAIAGFFGDPPGGGTSSPGTNGLDPDLARRLQAMMQENPRLTVTSGYRSRDEQEALYNRYLAGGPVAAKPGTSQHEKGLAVDLGPSSEWGWLASNAARFGLVKTVGSEPWHFEPVGARTGSNLAAARAADEGDMSGGAALKAMYLGGKYGSVSASSAVSSAFGRGPNRSAPGSAGGGSAGNSGTAWAGGKMSINDVAALAKAAGLPQGSLVTALAIAMAESSLDPSASHTNANGSIDRGLWEINSVHGGLSTFDTLGNAQAMVSISGKGSNWNPWATYKSGAYKQYLSTVQQALSSGVGDPRTPASGGGGSVVASKVIHIANVHLPVQMPAGTSMDDAQQFARNVKSALQSDRIESLMGSS